MGLDDNRFTGDVDEDFRCSICQDIIEDPIASQCEHVFCKICIYQWLQRESSCPVDRKPLNISQLCEPSRFFRNFYSKLVLKCCFESSGCKNRCKIEDLNSHQNKCKFNLIVKSECEKGCEALLTRNELKSHNCIEYLKSKYKQDLEKANKKQSEHEELINDLQTMLSMKCDEINDLKLRIDSLMSSTSNLIGSSLASISLNSVTDSVSSPEQKQLVESLKAKGVVKTPRVERALLSVDRKLFCSSDPYSDRTKSIGFGSTISAPNIHATILELLEKHLKNGSHVLDIGSGSGYLTICMRQMVGSNGQVIGLDHVSELINRSKENVAKNFTNFGRSVFFLECDGRNGHPVAAALFDVINIGGAVTQVPQTILNQLKIGGRLVASIGPRNEIQKLVTIDKLLNGSLKREVHMKVIFGSLQDAICDDF